MDRNLKRLYRLVEEAYHNALLNGYKLDEWTAEAVAEDMCLYDADIEKYFISDVVYCVEHLRKNK